jgi:chemosensory pili system protein ChpA (sensor histidine kinase/response regulator)
LKGSSNIVGIKGIANIAHPLEDTLEYLATHKVVPPKALTDMMVEAADCLEMMVETLSNGQPETPSEALPVLQSVLDWANRIDAGNLDADVPPHQTAPAPTPKTEKDQKDDKKDQKDDQKDKQVTKPTTKPVVPYGAPEQFLKVPAKRIDELMRLVGELSISVVQIQDKLKHLMQNTQNLSDQNLIIQHLI